MKIQIDSQYKKLCFIQQIKPGQLKYQVIIIGIILSLICLGIPIFIYLKWQRFRNIIHSIVFQTHQHDSSQVEYYLIVDSKRSSNQFRTQQYRNSIVRAKLIKSTTAIVDRKILQEEVSVQKQSIKIIEHKGLKYLIRNNTLYSVKFKLSKSLEAYFREGLTDEQQQASKQLFGQTQQFTINFWNILKKTFHHKKLRFVFMFFAIKKILVGFLSIHNNNSPINDPNQHHSYSIEASKHNNQNQFFVAILILAEILLALSLTLFFSIMGARNHNKIHHRIINQTKKYEVFRNGQLIEVKLNELYVGDIVIPKTNDVVYFKGLLVAEDIDSNQMGYMIVNEKLYNRKDQPLQKNSIINHLNEVTQINIINPGSQIINMNIKKQPIHEQQQSVIKKESIKLRSLIKQKSKIKEPQEQIHVRKSESLIVQIKKKSNIDSNIAREREKTIKQKKSKQFFIKSKQQSIFSQQQQPTQNSLNKRLYIIVTDNNYIQKFYKCYKQTNYWDNYSAIKQTYDFEQMVFQFCFLILALIPTVWIVEANHTTQHWVNIIFSQIILFFPFNLALFSNFSEFISFYRLTRKGIYVVNPLIQEIGLIDHLSLQISAFQKTQFSGFVKKQRCVRIATAQRFEDSDALFDIFKRARQDSIYGFLLWAGMLNLLRLNNEEIYKQIFDKYEFEFKQKNEFDEDDGKINVINKTNKDSNSVIKIDWKQYQRFPLNEKLIQTMIVQDVNANQFENKLIIVSEGFITNQKCFNYFDQIIVEQGKAQFRSAINKLFLQGKKIKYISFKRNFIKNQRYLSIRNFKRNDIQNKLLFCGFLIFDEWPDPSSMNALISLDTFGNEQNITIFANKSQNSLIGYDHILRKSKILFNQQSEDRNQQTFVNKRKHQTIVHIGNGIIDQSCMLMADVSINKISESLGQADFQIQQPRQAVEILYQGFWALYNTTLTIVCLVLFNFSKVVGQLFKYQNNPNNKAEISPLGDTFDEIFLLDLGALILPIFLLNLHSPKKQLKNKSNRHFFRIQLFFYIFFALLGLGAMYFIQFLDHGFQNMCTDSLFQTNLQNGINHDSSNIKINQTLIGSSQSHWIKSRHFNQTHHVDNKSLQQNLCDGLVNFITVSFAFLVILLVDRQSCERKANNIAFGWLNKIYMLVLWVASILYYKIAFFNVLRLGIIIILLTGLVWGSQWLKQSKKSNMRNQQQDQIPQSFINDENHANLQSNNISHQ